MRTLKTVVFTAVCIILGIVLSWQFMSVRQNQVLAQYERKSVNELVDELLMEKNNNEELKARVLELQQEVNAYKSGQTGLNEQINNLKRSILEARIMAGLVTVKGSGIVLTIESEGLKAVEDRNIEEVLNELKATDVQAISVNNERIVATSEIRNSGDYIMINGIQLIPPYTIKAIGDPGNLENTLNLLGGVLEKFQYYEFKVNLKKDDNIIIPAVRDDGTVLRINMLTPVE